MNLKNAITTLLLLFSCWSNLFAQKPFLGTWVSKSKGQQSINGILRGNATPKQIVVSQDSGGITISEINATAPASERKPDDTVTEKFATKLDPFVTTTKAGRKKTVTLTWSSDENKFTEITQLNYVSDPTKVEIKYTSSWEIIEGQLILQIRKENFAGGESYEVKDIYEKL